MESLSVFTVALFIHTLSRFPNEIETADETNLPRLSCAN